MRKKVSIVLVGAGGYGNIYINELLNHMDKDSFSIVGVVDPNPQGCKFLKKLEELRIPFFQTIEEFYMGNNAELAVISSPIQYHSYQSCYAMMHGSNVLCEKPVSATVQDALKMTEVRNKTGKFLAIGYQLSFNDAVLELKRDIMEGKLGRPLRLKTVVLWPRDKKYYSRKWAGKKKDEYGNWVLDSVAANATAHYLNNMLFVLGEKEDGSIYPSEVKAELYRANDIENFDTVAAHIIAQDGVDIMFYASHAVNGNIGPVFCYEFEKAVVTYKHGTENSNLIAQFKDGTIKNYGNPFDKEVKKLWICIDAAGGLDVNITSKVETAIPHIICVNGMQESVPEIINFPKSLIKVEGEPELVWVDGLKEILLECYEDWALPSEKEIWWAKAGEKVNLVGYKYFGA
ncbi:MAG: Gfo/Idh/MocA family oxidoreductase [Firmicutes bacterium]|nr:Gfo/Idh/MocA family oxidoreductase [Bacillota bacterium]